MKYFGKLSKSYEIPNQIVNINPYPTFYSCTTDQNEIEHTYTKGGIIKFTGFIKNRWDTVIEKKIHNGYINNNSQIIVTPQGHSTSNVFILLLINTEIKNHTLKVSFLNIGDYHYMDDNYPYEITISYQIMDNY